MQVDTESCTQRRRKQSAACGGTHQRKRIQVYLYASCRRTLVNHDIDTVVFHGRVEIFLHHRTQAVYLVNKQHIVRLQAGKDPRQVARLVEHRPRCNLKPHSQFVGNDVRQCSLSQSGRAVQQHMVQRFAAQACRLYKNAQVVHHLILSAEVLKGKRAQGFLKIAFLLGEVLVAYIEILLFHDDRFCEATKIAHSVLKSYGIPPYPFKKDEKHRSIPILSHDLIHFRPLPYPQTLYFCPANLLHPLKNNCTYETSVIAGRTCHIGIVPAHRQEKSGPSVRCLSSRYLCIPGQLGQHCRPL